ncbi:glycine-rich domain-containing protein [Ketogulonicigenium vulgare]|uniref:glycine-rich domain-containing protein n=1 Tax=Ketogulonicigenium vulgare TaxID=92945 RepID=UPI002359C8A6|nr:hypothetical protein [Ketogulonicigenium vulgare]
MKIYFLSATNEPVEIIELPPILRGATGETGPQGVQGIKGDKGDQGDTGPQGLQGIQGATGARGAKGDRGDQGLQGIQGLTGPKGDKGDRGDIGPAGQSAFPDGQGILIQDANGDRTFRGLTGHEFGTNTAQPVVITQGEEQSANVIAVPQYSGSSRILYAGSSTLNDGFRWPVVVSGEVENNGQWPSPSLVAKRNARAMMQAPASVDAADENEYVPLRQLNGILSAQKTAIDKIEFLDAGLNGAIADKLNQLINALRTKAVMTVHGGIITQFERDGIAYTQIELQSTGGFTLNRPLLSAWIAAGAGGGNGGAFGGDSYRSGGGGAGEFFELRDSQIDAGTYVCQIGAGAPRAAGYMQARNGSDTILYLPNSPAIILLGGGRGASAGSSEASGNHSIPLDGGSGGGARGSATMGGAGGLAVGSFAGNQGGMGNAGSSGARSGGGGGGAASAGKNGGAGFGGAGGQGVTLDWLAQPLLVCAGGAGQGQDLTGASDNATYGSGSFGARTAGAGGNGFLFVVVKSADVDVRIGGLA